MRPFKDCDWDAELLSHKLGYTGNAVAKAETLTWEQILPALPPVELAGRAKALDVAHESMEVWLKEQSRALKPEAQWPAKPKSAQVRAVAEELDRILSGLAERKIVAFLRLSEVHRVHGHPLLNGAFGVSPRVRRSFARTRSVAMFFGSS